MVQGVWRRITSGFARLAPPSADAPPTPARTGFGTAANVPEGGAGPDQHPIAECRNTDAPPAASAGDACRPYEGPPLADVATLRRSLDWRARVLLSSLPADSRTGDGPAVVTTIQRCSEGMIRQLPVAAQQALAIARNPESGSLELAGLFERDPMLAQALLKECNSAWFGRGGEPILSIIHAMQRVGLQGVENVLMTSIMNGMLCRPGATFEAMAGQVWSHMVRTALLARRLAPAFGVHPDRAYTLALLHDVGKLVLFDHISALRKDLRREIVIPEHFLCQILVHLHEPIGGQAALRWGLGDEAARAIAAHHRHPAPSLHDPLSEVLFVAERVDLALTRNQKLDWAAIWADGLITAERLEVEAYFARIEE